jgi:glucose/arabinose dehydrogenase
VKDEKLLAAPFLDISNRVGSNTSERGLLGLAFHPKYKETGYFYVNYTDNNGNTVISRFKVTSDLNIADPASEKKLLGVQQPFPNHNGGSVVFGPDGYLYLGLGDGGSQGDPHGNGQSTKTLLGKILRIDIDHGDPYAIPADNPFASGGGNAEIWAYGLRNPWRFSFDPATGDLYIGDVGQDIWEEIDYLPAGSPGGANFGWNAMEGKHPFKGSDSPSFIAPVIDYSHSEGGCSVTGGYVYRGAVLPEWNGVYFYGDYCSGKVWGLLKNGLDWKSAFLFDTKMSISTFGVDENGEIYLAWYGGGIYRLAKK